MRASQPPADDLVCLARRWSQVLPAFHPRRPIRCLVGGKANAGGDHPRTPYRHRGWHDPAQLAV